MHHTTLKQIISLLFCLYIAVTGFISLFNQESPVNMRELPELPSQHAIEEGEQYASTENPYKFKDPYLAYDVLTIIDVLPEKGFKPEATPKKPLTNLKNDDDYCDKARDYAVFFTHTIFEKMTFLSDMSPGTLVRSKVLNETGVDVQPHVGAHLAKNDATRYQIDPSVTSFYSRYVFFNNKQLGRQYSCIFQMSNHLPGNIVIARKFTVTEAAIKYAKRYESRPQCFDLEKFLPKTYLLYDKEGCENFFKVLNSVEYKTMKKNQKIIYLKKAGEGVHMGAGVDLVDEDQEADLRATYVNGKKCGKVNDLFLIQKYIPNPLLIHGCKFDFRSYVMIASTNPLIAYYHDPTLRVSLMPYDANSTDKKIALTNIALSQDLYEEAVRDGIGYRGMNESELKTAQQWTFSRFEQYLLESGAVKDPSWFDSYLRPQFKKAMIHLLRLGLVAPVKSSSVYGIFGLDFMLDENFNLYFIEANSAPGMAGFSQPVEDFVVKMLKDEIEIAIGLLRSRMKRVIKFVNDLIDNGLVRQDDDGNVSITDLETNRMIFDNITKNRFEEEFMPSPGNGFQKIIDENYPGADKYRGLLSQECL